MKRQHGFTLVELAIALMVIGLLIGGVLKGQELIENARVTAFIRQVKAYDAATMIFKNTYGALPGDIKKPNRIPNCTTDLCLTAGNGNGRIEDIGISDGIEGENFFPHLTKAGMIQGPEGGTIADVSVIDSHDLFFPLTPFDVPMHVVHGLPYRFNAYLVPPLQTNISYSQWPPKLPVKIMQQIDAKIDDGRPLAGDVKIYDHGDCPIDSSNNEYQLDYSNNYECSLVIPAGF